MLNWIVRIVYRYLKPFNYVQIKQLMLDHNTWSQLTVGKQMINT